MNYFYFKGIYDCRRYRQKVQIPWCAKI